MKYFFVGCEILFNLGYKVLSVYVMVKGAILIDLWIEGARLVL